MITVFLPDECPALFCHPRSQTALILSILVTFQICVYYTLAVATHFTPLCLELANASAATTNHTPEPAASQSLLWWQAGGGGNPLLWSVNVCVKITSLGIHVRDEKW